jgi:hypothetical protein
MSLIKTVLIDTNIFDKHAYHFTSAQIAKFAELAKLKKMTLLLPDALEREIIRHIKEKSSQAQSALKKARREAHFLPKWSHWPTDARIELAKDEIETAAMKEWHEFLKHFKVEKLGYGDIDMKQVMDWYDQKQPPFGDGPKQKEFPDAFIMSSTVAYAKKRKTKVAVVSEDGDVKRFCTNHPDVICFPDLPTLTESIIAATQAQIANIKAALAANPAKLKDAIGEDFADRMFYPEEDPDGDVSDVTVKSIKLSDVRLIELDEDYCTIAFNAEVEFLAFVSYDDPDTMVIDSSEDFRMALYTRAGTVTDTIEISASATLEFDDDWKIVVSVSDLEMEKVDFCVKTRPPIQYDDDPPDEDSLIANLDNMPEIPLPQDLADHQAPTSNDPRPTQDANS